MPTYEYTCKDCGERLEAYQSFTDEPLSVCPACGGALRKVFGNIAITFKGSGFYKTDSRGTTKSSSDGGAKSEKAESASSDTKADTKSESKSESKSDSSKSDSAKSTATKAESAA